MQHLSGFAPLAARYDGFIFDLWGVIHDGVTAYPGAVDCLARVEAAGKPFALLSNAPRRAEPARAAMRAMGIPDAHTARLLTSGEAVHRALRDRADPWFAALGRRVFHLGPERDRNVLAGLDLDLVAAPREASFVLNTGPDDQGDPTSLAPFLPVLDACRAADLPMICANPDLEVIRGGVRVICAGLLAQHYTSIGGEVRSLGKPDPAIYAPVLAMLGTTPARTLAVGDALRTDIAGAAAAGIDAAWVLGGIHADALAADPGRIEAAAREAGLTPVASLPRFVW
ncbi:MAG TPA: TIGR01459 family HAD-type hydrolase [Acetobacteraceae bacterium]|nr:TIGR01459 family HAD-type hydrolase [Acetobacteraceae bacterium]